MITMEHVCKSYKIAKRNAGFGEALKALFHREYEVIRALDNVTFTIGDGEMVGYIGPNGAGKSSTIKILSGILTPDHGTVLVDGRVPYKDRIRHVQEIGVVFGQRSQLWWDVPVIDSFELLKDIYSITEPLYRQSLEELTELLNLTELLRSPARQLSLGQRMRCEIAASLLHRTGRRVEACRPRLHIKAESDPRHHRDTHYPRHAGHRSTGKPYHPDRKGTDPYGRYT